MEIRTLIIKFDGNIANYQIPEFRGAIINASQGNVLFHNHLKDSFRYSYPLIQYKKIGNYPSVVCIGDGTEKIGEIFENGDFTFRIGDKVQEMKIESIRAHKINVQLWDTLFKYNIRRWLPLNSENYAKYVNEISVSKKMLLENILKANILSFCKSMDIFLEDELKCEISYISDSHLIRYKNIKMMSFDIDFYTNISLPSMIGLGKNSALGFGTIYNKHKNDVE